MGLRGTCISATVLPLHCPCVEISQTQGCTDPDHVATTTELYFDGHTLHLSVSVLLVAEQALIWSAWYLTKLLVKLMPKVVAFSFLFFQALTLVPAHMLSRSSSRCLPMASSMPMQSKSWPLGHIISH